MLSQKEKRKEGKRITEETTMCQYLSVKCMNIYLCKYKHTREMNVHLSFMYTSQGKQSGMGEGDL